MKYFLFADNLRSSDKLHLFVRRQASVSTAAGALPVAKACCMILLMFELRRNKMTKGHDFFKKCTAPALAIRSKLRERA